MAERRSIPGKAFDFILFGNLFIAFGAAAQGLLTYHFIHQPYRPAVIFVLFLSTGAIYNFSMVRFDWKSIKSDGSKRLDTIAANYGLLKILTILYVLAILPLLFQLKPFSILVLSFLGLISVLYSLPFIRFRGRLLSLRQIPGAKMILISFVWAISTVFIPVFESEVRISDIVLDILLIKRFLFIAATCIAFDIRDIFKDQIKGLETIPAMIGERNAKILSALFLIVYFILLIIPQAKVPGMLFLPLMIALFVQIMLVLYAKENRSDYYYLFWLDGVFILQYLLVLLFDRTLPL